MIGHGLISFNYNFKWIIYRLLIGIQLYLDDNYLLMIFSFFKSDKVQGKYNNLSFTFILVENPVVIIILTEVSNYEFKYKLFSRNTWITAVDLSTIYICHVSNSLTLNMTEQDIFNPR